MFLNNYLIKISKNQNSLIQQGVKKISLVLFFGIVQDIIETILINVSSTQILLVHPKYFFQYCDSNIVLFPIAPHTIIVFNFIKATVVALISLLIFLVLKLHSAWSFFFILHLIQLLLFQVLQYQQLSLSLALTGDNKKKTYCYRFQDREALA